MKAQYYEATQGNDPETGAQKAAEKAIASLGQYADQEAKVLIAKKTANMYIKQEREKREAIDKLDKAIRMLGNVVKKGGPNRFLTGCVDKVKMAIR